ncbi:MAG: GAF domain-containing protein, partial [Anaerolineae bacterium]
YRKSRNELSLPLVVDQGIRADPSTLDLRDGGGLAGWVVRNTEPVWVNNWEKEQDALPSAAVVQGFPTGSLMVLPLVARDEVIGVISAQSPKPGVFDKGHRRLFSGIAHQVAIAVENARLFEEARRRLADVESLQEVTLAAVSTLDFDLVLERTVRALHRTLGIDRLGFLLPNERGDMLEPHPSLVGFANSGFQVPVAGSLAGRAYRSGQLALVRDLRDGEVEFDQEAEIRSALAVPVRIGSRIVAVLRAESPEVGAFGEDEVRLFTTLAGQLGVVLESARLYQRLEEQRDELGQAYEELRKVDRLRTELVQNVSHELRTPFSLVQGYIELMANEDLGPLLQEQQAALKIIANRVSILEHLIHDLTTLDETSRKEAQSRATCIVETMESALEEFKLRANRAGIRFRREMPEATPKVLADQGQLLRAFSHLLDNAIKFSPAGGTVTICAWEQDDQSCISVADEGIGIPAEHLDHIFERFYQVDGGMSRRFGGMGIGLALVSEIVEAHGGSVEVESTPQKGSTFTVALPQVELDDQPDG